VTATDQRPAAGSRRVEASPVAPAAQRKEPLLQRPLTSYYLLLGCTGLLVLLGLIMVFSASSVRSFATTGSSLSVVTNQVIYVMLGIPLMWVAMRLPVRFYRAAAYPLLLGSAIGLMLVLVPGIGHEVDGARRWIDVGPLSLQPSEPAKLALALWGADLLVRKRSRLGEFRHLLIPLIPVSSFFAFLVMLEPDLGTTLAIGIVVLGLLWFVGAPLRLFAGLVGTCLVLVVGLIAAEPYRMRRVTGFLDPFADPLGSGYQSVQGLYAVSSGGWTGVGLGASREKWNYLPNGHTDFIFAIIGEELGLLGSVLVLLLFAGLTIAGLRIASRATDPFAKLVAGAVTLWIVGQAIINVCTVIGLMPITGIPLPLLSYGGTALIVTMIALGMLASFARAEPGAAAALAARPVGPFTLLVRRLGDTPLGAPIRSALHGPSAPPPLPRPLRSSSGARGSRPISPRAARPAPRRGSRPVRSARR
jgi:cell division protein FtsW